MFENEIEEEASIRFESKFQLAAISVKLTPDDELESFRVSHLQFFFSLFSRHLKFWLEVVVLKRNGLFLEVSKQS